MTEDLQTVLTLLRQTRDDGGPGRVGCGICAVIELHEPELSRYALDTFDSMMQKWPEYSGDDNYPVPGLGYTSACEAYIIAQDELTLWDESTEYGAARWRLLDWLIAQLEAAEKCADALQELPPK